ncbi:TIGR02221 family CRISPR-associated protein [Prevotella nigrescens]|jgi:CRISPR-associated protein, TM1812 family|uniref:TIGR02221 family CRISPR-associated protein n=1 Tax=Prevotella nigrescens TaxID=28133 RepID=UPI003C7139FD
MARKVFISVLGTGLYERGIYTKGEFKSTETRFIQQATIELLGCKETWTEDDKICILLTEQTRKLNWDVTVRKARCTGEEIPYEGLKDILKEMHLKPAVLDVPISDGKDEKEMWDIFQTVFNLLQEDDELYFDLTHSFRYLPMLILVLGNYAKFLKNVQIAHISYGNYEARNKNGSPIVNLLPLAALQDWTFAAADYLHNGQSEQLVQLTKNAINPILKATLGKDEGANSLKKLFTTLETITSNMQTCRGLPITQEEDVFKLKQSIESSSADIIPPLVPVIKEIEKSFSNFSADANTINGLHAAKWCYKNRMYQQAITILQETIVTMVCKKTNLPIENDKTRGLVNSAFYIVFNKKQHDEDSWSLNYESRDEAIKIVRELIQLPIINDLSKVFSDATELRNDFNHAGFRPNPSKINKIRDNIGKCINEVFNLLIPQSDVH